MKRIVVLLFLSVSVYALAGCKKDKAEKAVRDSIIGSWELRHVDASFIADFEPGNGNMLKFTATTYEHIRNGQLEKSGSYEILREESPEDFACRVQPRGAYKYRIIYDNDANNWTTYLRLSNNQLQLITGCFANDSGSLETYEKVSSQ